MNLTNAAKVQIDGKTVSQIRIGGDLVYDAISMLLTSSREYLLTGETATITVTSEKLKNKTIELFKVINMTRTSMGSETTDSNGVATWDYEGSGVGDVGFIAVYGERESNMVSVDDYIPVADTVGLTISNNNVSYGTSVTLTATVKDQHNQNLSSGTVTFKDGNTSIGTGSITNGIATLSISTLGAGNHSLTAEINNKTSSSVALTVSKANTVSTITPPTLYYKDEFDVSGKLTLSDGVTGVVGKTVSLLWNDGSDHTATVETVTGGVFSFHRDAPTTIREYTFKVTYAGDDNYNASETGTSSVTVNKELTVLTVTSPTSGTAVSNDFTVTGTLKDDDGHVLDTSATVSLRLQRGAWYEIGTATVGSDGSFSITADIDELGDGSNTLRARYSESSHYGSSYHEFSVSKVSYDGMAPLEKSAGKSILSYADKTSGSGNTEYCTVRAQLTVSDSPASISGVPITFGVYKKSDDSLIGTTSTVNTDSNGQATYTYTSAGAGDVYIKAECSSLIQTYPIQDCLKAYELNGTESVTTIDGYTPSIVDNTLTNGCGYLSDGFDNTDDWELTFDYSNSVTTSAGVLLVTQDTSQRNKYFVQIWAYLVSFKNPTSSVGSTANISNFIANTWYAIKITKVGTTVTVYCNDTQVNQATISTINNYNSLYVGVDQDSRYHNLISTIKNIRIKPL